METPTFTTDDPTKDGYYWFRSRNGFIGVFHVMYLDTGDLHAGFYVEYDHRSRGCEKWLKFKYEGFEIAFMEPQPVFE